MKKGLKIVLLAIGSIMLLTACGGSKTGESVDRTEHNRSEQRETTNHADIDESMFESKGNITDTETVPDREIDYEWYVGKCYRGTVNAENLFFIQDDTVNTSRRFICRLDEMSMETIEDKNIGVGLKYFYYTEIATASGKKMYDSIIIEYYPSVDRVILTEVGNAYKESYNVSDVYEYDSALPNNNQGHNDNNAFVCSFFDGQRFECFETASGKTMTLTVHLFYSDDSNTPSAYKGELSDGVEFWFNPYEITSEYERYIIDCADGTTAYMYFYPEYSDMEFVADEESDEYGNMAKYSGTYIGLPDNVEE